MKRFWSVVPSVFAGASLLIGDVGVACAADQTDPLISGFEAPPDAARPRVWWHWMNGNVTQEGIRRDLEWMKRIGIGGINVIDASMGTPQVVDQRLVYMSPPWRSAFRYTVELADSLGLELSINSSPGFSETGGPWVRPAHGMKKLVWSTTHVQGGKPFAGILALPPKTTGPFQNVAAPHFPFLEPFPAEFYGDTAVIAYRVPAVAPVSGRATVTSSAGPIDTAQLEDGELQTSVSLRADKTGQVWVQWTYDHPQTVRSAVLGTPEPGLSLLPVGGTIGRLEARDPQGDWYSVATMRIQGVPQVTVSFTPVTARVFRILFSRPDARTLMPLLPPAPGADPSGSLTDVLQRPMAEVFAVSELRLEVTGRVNEFERKAGFGLSDDYYALSTPHAAANGSVAISDVVDLSRNMTREGFLNWTPPPGQWIVLRLGYSLIGGTNHPAPPEATGLEVDKLNGQYVKDYMNNYLDTYSSFLPPSLMGHRGVHGVTVDSSEVGPQNWTDDVLEQFKRLRGYDARPFLPVLTGVIVDSAESSDKFLWDFRRTIADLTAQAHYAEIAHAAHARGLQTYSEALELGRPQLGDDMEMRRYADVPMGAMWTAYPDQGPLPSYLADDRGAASVAHLYGQNLVGAESFTTCAPAPWAFAPRDLKPVADLEFALGINRIIVHSSVHQPTEKSPGLSLGPCGQYFNRHETWAEAAGAWISYLARSSYMLQQGRYAADVAYFYGEEAPLTVLQIHQRLNDTPQQYAFDFVNSNAILNLLTVRDGVLTTPSGMRYRALQLGGTSGRMTLPVLRKIRDFVREGLIVVGSPPIDSPSLADDEAEFERIKTELWGRDGHGTPLGRGRVYGKGSVEQALSTESLAPDFIYSRPHLDTQLMFLHRTLADGEIYFLTNRQDRTERLEASFRVTGKAPEVWHAETGKSERASFRVENGRTIVPLQMYPYDAVFVVFRRPTVSTSLVVPKPVSEEIGTLTGSWTVSFQLGRGAPPSLNIDALESWSDSLDPGIRYFSGTATYRKTIEAPQAWFRPGARLVLDLGEVREVAEIQINDSSLGTVWKAPYAIDVTDALHPGGNTVEVKVTNLWVNRLIGDQQPGAVKYTSTIGPTYFRTAPLRASGLIGPVTLRREIS